MVLFPKTGGNYWIVTDIYERFCAIPVTLMEKGGLFDYGNGAKGLFLVRWQISDEYAEDYDATRRELFRSYRAAARVAKKLNAEAKKNEEG